MRKRVNGLEWPLTPYQLGAIAIYVFVITSYHVLMYTDTGGKFTVLIIVDVCLTFVALLCWFIIEYLDPAVCSVSPEYYCQLCGKRIPKLDHHCLWLNTCIGARNVRYFHLLIGTLFVQEGMQLVMLAMSSLWSVHYWLGGINKVSCLLICHTLACGVMWVGVTLLVCFHLYLQLIVGKTTYDWLISRSSWPDDEEEESTGHVQLPAAVAAEDARRKKEAWENYLLMKRQKPAVDLLASVQESVRSHNAMMASLHDSSAGSAPSSVFEGGIRQNDSYIKSERSSQHMGSAYDNSSLRKSMREPHVDADHMLSYKSRNPNDSLDNNNSYRASASSQIMGFSYTGAVSYSGAKFEPEHTEIVFEKPLNESSPMALIPAGIIEDEEANFNVDINEKAEKAAFDVKSISERLSFAGKKSSTVVPVTDSK